MSSPHNSWEPTKLNPYETKEQYKKRMWTTMPQNWLPHSYNTPPDPLVRQKNIDNDFDMAYTHHRPLQAHEEDILEGGIGSEAGGGSKRRSHRKRKTHRHKSHRKRKMHRRKSHRRN